MASIRRCYLWFRTHGGFVCYGAPRLLGLGALQLTCRGLCGPGRSAVLLRSGGGVLTRRLPLLLPACDQPLCFEDPAFSIGMLCRPSRSTMDFTWLVEYVLCPLIGLGVAGFGTNFPDLTFMTIALRLEDASSCILRIVLDRCGVLTSRYVPWVLLLRLV